MTVGISAIITRSTSADNFEKMIRRRLRDLDGKDEMGIRHINKNGAKEKNGVIDAYPFSGML
jgi:hypothetical protein